MAMNNDELLEYLMAYIENELSCCEDERDRLYNMGEFEGILLMLDVLGLDKISHMLYKKYSSMIHGDDDSVNEET